jgi:Pentapeptide repeats (8 copies)
VPPLDPDTAPPAALDLRGADLRRRELSGAGLRGALLEGSRLHQARLRGADLRDAAAAGLQAPGADFEGADLRGADLRSANLRGAVLRDAHLAGTDLRGAQLVGVDLRGVDLTGAQLDVALAPTGGATIANRVAAAFAALGRAAPAAGTPTDQSPSPVLTPVSQTHKVALGLSVATLLGAMWVIGGRSTAPDDSGQASPPEGQVEAAEWYADKAEHAPSGAAADLWLEAGARFLSVGDPDRARAALQRALSSPGITPDGDWLTRLRLAEAARLAGDQAGAAAALEPLWIGADATRMAEMLLTLDPRPGVPASLPAAHTNNTAALVRLELARLRQASGDPVGAAAEVVAALEADPSVDARWRSARLALESGDAVTARQLFEALAADRDRGAPARWELGSRGAAFELGDSARAVILEMRRVADPAAARSLVLTALASPDLSLGDARLLRRALASVTPLAKDDGAPDLDTAALDPQVRLARAEAQLQVGDGPGALAALADLAADTSTSPAERWAAGTGRAQALGMGGGDPEQAARAWAEQVELANRPADRSSAECGRLGALADGGQRDAAMAGLRSLLADIDPAAAHCARLGIAAVYRLDGLTEAARGTLEDALLRATGPSERLQAADALASLYLDLDLPAGARRARFLAWDGGLLLPEEEADQLLALAALEAQRGALDVAEGWLLRVALHPTDESGQRRARLELAELAEERDRPADAATAYDQLLNEPGLDAPATARARLGLTRSLLASDQPTAALEAVAAALLVPASPEAELELRLLEARARFDLDPQAPSAWTELDGLVAAWPRRAGPALVAAAEDARGRQELELARALIARALQADLDAETRQRAALAQAELALEDGAASEVDRWLTVAAAGPDTNLAFEAGLLRAEAERRGGQPGAAVLRLEAMEGPNLQAESDRLLALAMALSDMGNPRAAAAWAAVRQGSLDDPASQSDALRGEADALRGADDNAGALLLYTRAGDEAPDATTEAWARLGQARALFALGRIDDAQAVLVALKPGLDPELELQRRMDLARIALAGEHLLQARELLGPAPMSSLGPAWDASWTEIAAASNPESADALWQELAGRWPKEPEATVPALLARAELALTEGRFADAGALADQAAATAKDPGYLDRAHELQARAAQGR